MNGSAVARLQRLRWLLTLLFTALNAAGVIIFALLFLREEDQQGEQNLDGELRRVTSSVTRLVQYADGRLITTFVADDQLTKQCPQFAVLPAGEQRGGGYLSERQCVPLDMRVLTGLANEAVAGGGLLRGYVDTDNGGLVRVGVEPFRGEQNQRYIGAVIAAADAEPTAAAYRQKVLLVLGGCVLLIGAVAAAGHLLSGRAIKPAVAALEQQEMLLAETAHDLRTPVAALSALAETAARYPNQRADLLPRTVRLARRMGGIIDSLLVRARLAAGVEQLAIQPVWLDQLVAGVIEETPTGNGSVTVTSAPTKVNADPGLLQRAIGNLLENALRHGRLPGATAVVHVTVAGGRVVVADHGPGIDPPLAEEHFDRFSSGAGSSGLGLSIVRWVALAHNGSLRVYNAEEGGAIFELVLPIVDH